MTGQVLVSVNSSSLTLSHLSLQLHNQSGVTMLTFSPSFRASFTYSEEVDNGYENDEFTLAVPSLAATRCVVSWSTELLTTAPRLRASRKGLLLSTDTWVGMTPLKTSTTPAKTFLLT